MERGYAVEPAMAGRMPSFEIAGYGRKLRGAFSTRRREILTYLAERGWDHSQAAAQMATLATRRRKDEPLRAMLETVWAERLGSLASRRARDAEAGGGGRPGDLSSLEIVAATGNASGEGIGVCGARPRNPGAGAFAGAHSLTRSGRRSQLGARWPLVDATLRRARRASSTDRTLKAERRCRHDEGRPRPCRASCPRCLSAARLAASELTEGRANAVRAILLQQPDRGVQGGPDRQDHHACVRFADLGRRAEIHRPCSVCCGAARAGERSGIHARTLHMVLTVAMACRPRTPLRALE